MPKISIRSLLLVVAFLALATAAIWSPNLRWVLITDLIVMLAMFSALALSIGAAGRLRISALTFLVTAVVCFVAVRFTDFPLQGAIQTSSSEFAKLIGTTENKQAPDGTLVYMSSEGSYSVTNQKGQWVKTPIAEIEKRGLKKFVYTDGTRVSFLSFRRIYQNLVFLIIATTASLGGTIAYNQRHHLTAET